MPLRITAKMRNMEEMKEIAKGDFTAAFYGRYLEVHRVVNSYKATNMTGGPPKAIHSRFPGP